MHWSSGAIFCMISPEENPYDTLSVHQSMDIIGLKMFPEQWSGREYQEHWRLGLKKWTPDKLRGVAAIQELIRQVWANTVVVERENGCGMFLPITREEVRYFHAPTSTVAGDDRDYLECRIRFSENFSGRMPSNAGRSGYNYPPIVIRILDYIKVNGTIDSIDKITNSIIAEYGRAKIKHPAYSKIQPYVSALLDYHRELEKNSRNPIPGSEACDESNLTS